MRHMFPIVQESIHGSWGGHYIDFIVIMYLIIFPKVNVVLQKGLDVISQFSVIT